MHVEGAGLEGELSRVALLLFVLVRRVLGDHRLLAVQDLRRTSAELGRRYPLAGHGLGKTIELLDLTSR